LGENNIQEFKKILPNDDLDSKIEKFCVVNKLPSNIAALIGAQINAAFVQIKNIKENKLSENEIEVLEEIKEKNEEFNLMQNNLSCFSEYVNDDLSEESELRTSFETI